LFNFFFVNEEYYVSIGLFIFIYGFVLYLFVFVNEYLNKTIHEFESKFSSLLAKNIELKQNLFRYYSSEFLSWRLLVDVNKLSFIFKRDDLRNLLRFDTEFVMNVVNLKIYSLFSNFFSVMLSNFFLYFYRLLFVNFFVFLKVEYANLVSEGDASCFFFGESLAYNFLVFNYGLFFSFVDMRSTLSAD
jgi:hypothetical protein